MTVLPLRAYDRYSDNGDGTITDHKTKLLVLKNANCFGKKGWQDALSAASKLASGLCDLSDGSAAGDWQLPTREMLPTLFDWTKSGRFSGMQTHFYWSNTAYTETLGTSSGLWAWVVYLGNGYVGRDDTTNGNYVWPVRNKI